MQKAGFLTTRLQSCFIDSETIIRLENKPSCPATKTYLENNWTSDYYLAKCLHRGSNLVHGTTTSAVTWLTPEAELSRPKPHGIGFIFLYACGLNMIKLSKMVCLSPS